MPEVVSGTMTSFQFTQRPGELGGYSFPVSAANPYGRRHSMPILFSFPFPTILDARPSMPGMQFFCNQLSRTVRRDNGNLIKQAKARLGFSWALTYSRGSSVASALKDGVHVSGFLHIVVLSSRRFLFLSLHVGLVDRLGPSSFNLRP